MKWYLQALKKYAVFSGRARRKEFWMYSLFCFIFAIVAMILDNILGTTFKYIAGDIQVNIPYGYIYLIYALATIIPGLAVTIRRLHDLGKSGWMFLIILIPIAGPIWLLVLECTDGTPGENEYGPNPKENEGEPVIVAAQ
jgi:uncharacterized membrane protein YhaH (DUF805 family)